MIAFTYMHGWIILRGIKSNIQANAMNDTSELLNPTFVWPAAGILLGIVSPN